LIILKYAGYLDTNKDKHYFYWFFESRGDPSDDPLILWLNGGPGCSSLTGLMMELGPCKMNKNGTDTETNPYSWNEAANIIFLDQPLNVGYSYGQGGASTTAAAADEVYGFLELFLSKFPKYRKNEFHIFGESYAGHYVPNIGKVINDNNKKKSKDSKINLKSIGIGNGLTDPLVQYEYYPDMACKNSYKPALPDSTCDTMRQSWPRCKSLIEYCNKYKNRFICFPAASYCNQQMIGPYQKTGLNPYDVRKKCGSNPLCYDVLTDIEKYFDRPDIKKALGANVETYKSCNMQINLSFNLAGDWMLPFQEYVAELLEDGVRALVYAGDADFICNWIGNKAWTKALKWKGKDGFNKARDTIWRPFFTGGAAGEARRHENFTFLRVYKAGHMVPYDQPENSLDMIVRWVNEIPF
jgi:cathepsin A (carboxypeptidase C)